MWFPGTKTLILCALLATAAEYGCGGKPDNETGEGKPSASFRRIVSLAPSITETLFAMGLGDRVVGITRYCRYPAAYGPIDTVGGYTDANLEKIVMLKPDLVILQTEHERHRTVLKRHGIAMLVVRYDNVARICSSFARIGRMCNAHRTADSLIERFAAELNQSKEMPDDPPRVLVCIGREGAGSGRLRNVFVAGAGTFYNDFIAAAGGVNAFGDSLPAYPKLSREGLLSCAPDIIIDIAPSMGAYACTTLVADWQDLPRLPAVRNGRIHCIDRRYATVPGPEVIGLAQSFSEIIDRGRR